MPLPIVFRAGGDAVATYDWIDFARKVGYVRFNAFASSLTAGTTHVLTTQDDITSWPYDTAMNLDLDFDITFTQPTVVGIADAIAKIAYQLNSDGHTINCTTKLYHVSTAPAETQICTGTLAQEAGLGSAGVNTWHYRNVQMPITTEKWFKPDEKLRFNVVMTTAGGGGAAKLMHDPANIAARTNGMLTSIDVPFKILS